MGNLDQCRNVKELNPLCQILLNKAIEEIKKEGIKPLVVETYRSQARQDYLYSVGRTLPGAKVTWTQSSIHTKRNAVDVIPQRRIDDKMTAIWNANDKETKKIIFFMQKYGFEAGANWSSSPDSPHFQIKGVSDTAKSYSSSNTNVYITEMIQKLLGITVDGKWGEKTTKAINKFRKLQGWKQDGKVGVQTLKKLLA